MCLLSGGPSFVTHRTGAGLRGLDGFPFNYDIICHSAYKCLRRCTIGIGTNRQRFYSLAAFYTFRPYAIPFRSSCLRSAYIQSAGHFAASEPSHVACIPSMDSWNYDIINIITPMGLQPPPSPSSELLKWAQQHCRLSRQHSRVHYGYRIHTSRPFCSTPIHTRTSYPRKPAHRLPGSSRHHCNHYLAFRIIFSMCLRDKCSTSACRHREEEWKFWDGSETDHPGGWRRGRL